MNVIILIMIVWMQPLADNQRKSTKIDFVERVDTIEDCFGKDPFSEATKLLDAKEQLALGRVPELMCAIRPPQDSSVPAT